MAPTEGRVARPERRWGCRRGTPTLLVASADYVAWLSGSALVSINVVTLRRARLILGWVTVCG